MLKADRKSSTAAWLGLGGIVLLTAAVRRAGWENWSLWLDEAIQVSYARRPLGVMLQAGILDGNHPPLDYVVTYLVRRISESDAALRAPALLWSVGTVLALFFRVGGFRRPLASFSAAFVFATLPLAIHYGQEVRPYSLALFFVVVADLARASWVAHRRRSWLAVYALAGIGVAYALYLGLFALGVVFALEVAEAWRGRRDDPARLRAALAVPAVVFVAFLPWLVALRGRPKRPNEMPAPRVTAALLEEYAVGFAADRQPSNRVAPALTLWTLALLGIASAPRAERKWIVVPLLCGSALVLALLTAADHWWGLRYVFLAVFPFAWAAGEGIAAVAEKAGRPALAGAFALTAVGLLQRDAIVENVRFARVDWRRVGGYLDFERRSGRGGTLAFADGWSYFVVAFQAGRLRPPLEPGPILESRALFDATLSRSREGWIVRTPHHPVPPEVDAALAGAAPWAVFAEAENARLYRFEAGRLVPP